MSFTRFKYEKINRIFLFKNNTKHLGQSPIKICRNCENTKKTQKFEE